MIVIKFSAIFMGLFAFSGQNAFAENRSQLKILHIMSNHSPWKWTDDQFAGLRYALKDLDVEYKVFQTDVKNKNAKDKIEKAGKISPLWKLRGTTKIA